MTDRRSARRSGERERGEKIASGSLGGVSKLHVGGHKEGRKEEGGRDGGWNACYWGIEMLVAGE